jgi:hypothetical protein
MNSASRTNSTSDSDVEFVRDAELSSASLLAHERPTPLSYELASSWLAAGSM